MGGSGLIIIFPFFNEYYSCLDECQTRMPPPSHNTCEDFFKTIGGRQRLVEENLRGAKILKDGKVHYCSTVEGTGKFGWCKVRCLLVLLGLIQAKE